MADNLWQPWPFYTIGVEISRFICKFAKTYIVRKALTYRHKCNG